MKHCIFCGPTEGPLTEEHIWPKWLSKLLRKKGTQRYRARRTRQSTVSSGDYTSTTRRPNILDLSINDLCDHCNNVVLSELENTYVKPIVIPLLEGTPTKLSANDLVALAAWITKIAMEYEFTDAKRPQFYRQEDRERFITTMEPPAGTRIWLIHYRGDHIAGTSQYIHLPKVPPGDAFVTTTGIIGRFGFQMLTRRDMKLAEASAIAQRVTPMWRPATVQVHPRIRVANWPPSEYLADDSINEFADRWGGSRGAKVFGL